MFGRSSALADDLVPSYSISPLLGKLKGVACAPPSHRAKYPSSCPTNVMVNKPLDPCKERAGASADEYGNRHKSYNSKTCNNNVAHEYSPSLKDPFPYYTTARVRVQRLLRFVR